MKSPTSAMALTGHPGWLGAVAGLAIVVQFVVPDGPARAAGAVLIYAAVTAAVIVGLRCHRPAQPWHWRLLALAMAFFTVDMVGWMLLELDVAPVFSELVVDVSRLLATLSLVGSVAVFVHQNRAEDQPVVGDVALILAGGALMFWQWYLLVQSDGSGRVVTVGVPVVLAGLAIGMGIVALRVVGVERLGSPAMLLLAAGAAMAIAAQAALTLTDMGDGPARWTDATWLVAGVLVGIAALHPTMAMAGEARQWSRVGTRLVLLGTVLLANPAVVWLHLLDPAADRRAAVAVAVTVGALTLIGMVRVGKLVAELGEMRTAVEHSERRFRALVQNASDVVAIVDRDGVFTYVSPPAAWILGYTAEELVGRRLGELVHRDDRVRFAHSFGAAAEVELPAPSRLGIRMRRQDGAVLSTELIVANLANSPAVEGIVVTIRDVTEQVEFEAELRRMASHDALTGLANRELFGDRVTHALDRAARHRALVGVVFIDLDDFKTVNDSLGHLAGDEVLKWVADRLRGALRLSDTAARLGGDEFAVLLEDIKDSADAIIIVERIREALREPVTLESREVQIGATIGLALGGGQRTAEELLRNADTAMFKAKAAGKNRYELFAPQMHTAARARFDLKADLHAALDGDQFELYYQPVMSLSDGSLQGFEALLRWNHPQRGLVEPLDFIGLMEETGQIHDVGRWVFRQALGQLRSWRSGAGFDPLWVSVNLSVRQFHQPDLVADLSAALAESGIAPSDLVVEITESVFMGDTEAAVNQLARLKRLGVRLAIDDFGTGYSALSYLQRFRADMVKVDKSFVDSLGDDLTLTGGIVGLARALGIVTVAEGVEHEHQVIDLRAIDCDLAQGFHLAVPQPAPSIDDYMARAEAG